MVVLVLRLRIGGGRMIGCFVRTIRLDRRRIRVVRMVRLLCVCLWCRSILMNLNLLFTCVLIVGILCMMILKCLWCLLNLVALFKGLLFVRVHLDICVWNLLLMIRRRLVIL